MSPAVAFVNLSILSVTLVAFNDANGKALKDSGIAVAKSSTGLTDSDTVVPTSKTVKTYVDSTATGISRYLGTITAASGMSTSAKKGDFYVVKTAWTGVHAGDEIIAEKDNPSQTIDGTNWSLLHNEADTDTKYTFATGDTNGTFKVTPSDTGTAQSVAVKGLGNAAYKGVADTVSTSTDLVTSAAVNTKLASYVPNSDFVVAEQNILSVEEWTGIKNKLTYEMYNVYSSFNWRNPIRTSNGVTFALNNDGSVSLSGTATGNVTNIIAQFMPNTDMAIGNFTGYKLSGGYSSSVQLSIELSVSPYTKLATDTGSGATIGAPAQPNSIHSLFIEVSSGTKVDGIIIRPMICTPEAWEYSHTWEGLALQNTAITPELIELCDSGAKNVYQVPSTIDNDAGLTITTNPSAGTITVSGTATKDRYIQISGNLNLYGTYVLQGCPSTGSSSTYYLHLEQSNEVGANDVGDKNYAGSTNTYNSASCKLYIRIFNGVAFGSGVTFTPMVCTKAAFGVSSKFVPYRPNWDLVGTIALQNYPKVIDPCDFNTLVDTGYYIVDQSGSTNLPWSHGEKIFLRVIRFAPGNSQNVMQIGWSFNNAAAEYCVRSRYLGTWSSWYNYKGTALS